MLKKFFNHTHLQKFDLKWSDRRKNIEAERMIAMLEATGLEATYRITDEGVEFGLTDQAQADALRLNIMAMYGDFGAYTHTESFDTYATREEWLAMGEELACAVGINVRVEVEDLEAHLDFEKSEDALIFTEAMRNAWNGSFDEAVALALEKKAQMRRLRDDVGPAYFSL